MASIPKKVAERLSASIKRFQGILDSAQKRDVNESDTVIIITDMLSDVFGYDKYSEVTSESAIRGTFCDLAIKIDGQLQFLVEAKAIGQELKDAYVKQAVDYAANQGADWVVLTNGISWRIYRVLFQKPIDAELVLDISFLTLSPRSDEHLEGLYLICREGLGKSGLEDYYEQKQALNRYSIAAVLMSEPVLKCLRRELKRLSPDVRLEIEQVSHTLEHEVIKRELVEGEKADEARRRLSRAASRAARNAERAERSEPLDAAKAVLPAEPLSSAPVPVAPSAIATASPT